jgi:DNA-directed RNA polymerase subunit RPC12/RpoP
MLKLNKAKLQKDYQCNMPMRYPHDHENDIIYFAKVNFRNKMQTFGIKTDDRRRHVYIVGKTGVGKTTLMENMILSDIYAGHGCAYIDPHGDTAEKLLDYIPSWRINDVVYFNPADFEYPIAFNVLESVDDKMKHLVVAGMMSVFKKIWEGVWSARMEYILNNTILALMDTPNTTLLGINRMLSDVDYRKEIVSNVKDPIVKQFWIKEFEGYAASFASEAVAPIQNKVGQFLSAGVIRNIVAQSKSSINIRQMMDDQKIFIVNLAKGRIGEDSSRLLGGLLITKLQMSAMERVDILESERQDFYMYVDEFQNFAVESFASILSEARKYRLNLIMAHQYIEQLTEEVRDAVFGNVGTIISFRVGGPDAAFMEEEFMPRFTPNDMINLPKFHIYLKLMIDGITSQPFSAITLHPIATRTGSEQKVITQSRERYAGIRSKIEEKVTQWSGFGADVDIEAEYAKTKQIKKDAKKARFSHEYTCTRCGKVFSLPVELDRSRPIYCEECHPIVMEERQKGKNKGQDSKARREETKKVIEKVPKIDEGEIVEKDVDGNSIKLVDLVEKTEEAVKDGITQQVPIEKNEPAIKAIDMLSAKSEQTVRKEETISISDQKIQGDQAKPKRKRRRRKRKQVGMIQEKQNTQVFDKKEADSVSVPKPVLPGEKVTFD